jgi:hypothetical protein
MLALKYQFVSITLLTKESINDAAIFCFLLSYLTIFNGCARIMGFVLLFGAEGLAWFFVCMS